MEAGTARGLIHDVIASVTPFSEPEADEDDLPEGGVVTGWVLVAEWQGTDGARWLSKVSSNASGDRSLPPWTERGLATEIAFHWEA